MSRVVEAIANLKRTEPNLKAFICLKNQRAWPRGSIYENLKNDMAISYLRYSDKTLFI